MSCEMKRKLIRITTSTANRILKKSWGVVYHLSLLPNIAAIQIHCIELRSGCQAMVEADSSSSVI